MISKPKENPGKPHDDHIGDKRRVRSGLGAPTLLHDFTYCPARGANDHESLRADWSKDAEMLTAKDLERWLKIDVKTIYSYVQRGLVPYVRIQSNVRFLRCEILEWIQQHSYHPRRLKTDRKRLGNET